MLVKELQSEIDWDALRIILAIEKGGSLSAAAVDLGVNQATVGRHLRRLEGKLESRLFNRFNYGLEPTTAGRKAIEVAQAVEREVTNLSREIVGSDQVATGTIRVSTPLGMMQYGLAEYFNEFCRQHPSIDIQMTATDATLSFVDRKVDIFIRAEDNPSTGLWGYKLVDLGFGFYASKEFLEYWRPKMIADPENVEVPFLARSTSRYEDDQGCFAENYPNANTVMACDDLESMIALVKAGTGIGRLPHFIANHSSGLETIPSSKNTGEKPLWVLTYPDLREIKRIRVFMELIKDNFAKRRAAFETSLFLGQS